MAYCNLRGRVTYEVSHMAEAMFKDITPEQSEAFLTGLKSGRYNLLLGAGVSHDSINHLGRIPLGEAFKKELCDAKNVQSKYSLQRVYNLLSERETRELVTDRFSGCRAGPTASAITNFIWRRIFTLNIDNCLEQAYSTNAKQKIHSLNFSEGYVDFPTLSDVPLIHLHGSVAKPDDGYVFSKDEYISLMKDNNPWMTVLSSLIGSEPFIIAGASFDEIDIEYYLSFRSMLSAREDAPPSILVEMEDDEITKSLCARHNLVHFKGYAPDFFRYCLEKIPHPPAPEDFLASELKSILPSGLDRLTALSFEADFEAVPAKTPKMAGTDRFYRGYPPSWSDLADSFDISRVATLGIIAEITKNIEGGVQILLISDGAGTGKTTILKRAAFDLGQQGLCHVFWARELGRVSKSTAGVLDLLDGPVCVFIDNIADHAAAVADLLALLQREDLLIVAAERSYRRNYLERLLGSVDDLTVTPTTPREVDRLVDRFIVRGLVGDRLIHSNRSRFIRSARGEPIAAVCCRIMNDLSPLDRIVSGLIASASQEELEAFLVVALAEHCFKGGVKASIAERCVDRSVLGRLRGGDAPLSIRVLRQPAEYLVTENSTISEAVLWKMSSSDARTVSGAFHALGAALAPYVNRRTIMARSPEAKLAGRLFDYDDVVVRFLGDLSKAFYDEMRPAWLWNSRYWEQVALMHHSNFFAAGGFPEGREEIEEAIRRARHAVSIEDHSFGLTTLGRMLMTFSAHAPTVDPEKLTEAVNSLSRAVEKERASGRVTVHPYTVLAKGLLAYFHRGGRIGPSERATVGQLFSGRRRVWERDPELRQIVADLRRQII